jgi:SOS-response transcriptional repressor LexA
MQYPTVITRRCAPPYSYRMTIADFLKAKMKERDVSGYALSEATGVPQPTIHRILTGESVDPKTTTVAALASYFEMTASEFRDQAAAPRRKTGKTLPAQVGNVTNISGIEGNPDRRRSVPVISFIMASQLSDINAIPDPGYEDWPKVRINFPAGERSWALRVQGDSMDDGTDTGIREGFTVICDPDRAPQAGDYVIAKDTDTQQATFKKLVTDAGRWYLKPLNRAYPTIEIDDPKLRVIAVVTEAQPPAMRLK